MSDPLNDKTVSEREAIMREREAYENGMVRGSAREFISMEDLREAVRRTFPLPKVTRPRVVTDRENPTIVWRFTEHAGFEWKPVGAESWMMRGSDYQTPRKVVMWADLYANPTEEVEDDE